MDLIFVRIVFILVVAAACYVLEPFGLTAPVDGAVGAAIGVGVILFEMRLHKVSLKRLIGAAIGSVLGILGALSRPASRHSGRACASLDT